MAFARNSLALWCLVWSLGCAGAPGRFEIALIGDQQYNAESEAQFPRLMDDLNRSSVAFVVHVGDFKAGTSMPCDDALFRSRKEHIVGSNNNLGRTPEQDAEYAPPRTPSGYADFVPALEAEVLAYGKPVLLLHGDTHYFRVDKPLFRTGEKSTGDSGRQIENFTRVEVHGFPEAHWVRVIVDPAAAGVFTLREEVVEANRFRR